MEEELLENWQNFYQDVFGLSLDLSDVQIPPKQEGFDRLIIVHDEVTPGSAFKKCGELFNIWETTEKNFDDIIIKPPMPRKTVWAQIKRHNAVWIKDTIEADAEFKNLSANDLSDKNINGITLTERLILELKYFKETNKHLDLLGTTMCSGSRYLNGSVPLTHWDKSDFFIVSQFIASGAIFFLRSRKVIAF